MIFTIPNDGHLNILKRMIRRYQSAYDFRLVLVDQRNSPPDLRDLIQPVVELPASRGFRNTPAARVFHRVNALLDDCLAVARDFAPDLIVYDFCALEGHLVGRILGIPAWCSIPGLMGPLTHSDFLADSLCSSANQRALAAIERRFGLVVERSGIEVISNCLHMPGELNLVWSYPSVTPANFLGNRKNARYRFVGYLGDGYTRRSRSNGRPTVYLSFGTEVMDNLWPSQAETRAGVRRCVAGLAELWRAEPLKVVFVTQGRQVLAEYPDNWTVCDKVDQQATLSRSDVFVTHGGSNSFHEAILLQVPMVVVPFFGDQVLVARRVEELGIGVDLTADDGIETTKPKRFLDSELPARIHAAVLRILTTDTYRRNFDDLVLKSAVPLLNVDQIMPSGVVPPTEPRPAPLLT
ncbi:MAG TPA: nucleotide disphospho-sugar-binding domain-containing protein [Micromonosporaceae bacterium]|nr:nucleotide disphospho-sugar-binding domain-containing protein [Micromonosporaceae bacterium]